MKKEKLLKQVSDLKSLKLDSDLNYSLTINYQNIVESFKYQELNLIEIENHINTFNREITSWNLTITNMKRYDESRFADYYFVYDLALTSDYLIVNFYSRFLQLPYCQIKDDSIEQVLLLIDFYKEKSKEIWDKVIKVSNFK